MPMYEYECSSCGKRFDVMQKFSDPVLTECRLCNAPGVRKVLSAPSFVLKGSGWYVTDYPSADRKKATDSEKPSSAPSESKPACAGSCASGSCPSKS
ncbi:MAG: hypothetical protein M0042_13260 [Nitrospiraceae bacterium]|nr:hypothetical protein [Nitrospiraceae bacterium]